MTSRIIIGHCLEGLASLPEATVQTCVTSPPYFNLRDYGVDGQIGLEDTPEAFVERLVAVFQEVRRVLRDDGTLWLNLGDSYVSNAGGAAGDTLGSDGYARRNRLSRHRATVRGDGIKTKDLLGIPWMVAFALRADGWYLRSAITWAKPNAMPDSCTDRPTNATEMVFLLSKRSRYFYDAAAIAEQAVSDHPSGNGFKRDARLSYSDANGARGNDKQWTGVGGTRKARNIWTIATQPFPGAHFATMPPELAERCIKAGSRPGDTVLDPFGGAGTTALVADRLGRDAIICELNPNYAALAEARLRADGGMFSRIDVGAPAHAAA